ncbi:cation:proton antiporter [Rhodobacter sp. NSM]|uniref:cation:proton antiporter n=1 Tax=Rhodobacter sp. NSM TaxID=3457501 RepID=UPI003FD42E69
MAGEAVHPRQKLFGWRHRLETHIALFVLFGAITLLTAWLPVILKDAPLTLPIICIAIGALIGMSPARDILQRNPLENLKLTERLTELVVIVALMGAGLKLDRPIGLRSWILTWRLLGIAMPLTIASVAFLGWQVLGLAPAAALLLGAVLAPTDPVLASNVQVGAPREGVEDDVRFALTSEAGLNDGLAFPFVYLAIALAAGGGLAAEVRDWLLIDVAWRLLAGLVVGGVTGAMLGYVTFRLPVQASLAASRDGFVAIGATFLSYGLAESVEGYGFIAVFVAALVLRAVEREHEYLTELHSFTEQIERLLMMVLLVCFGAAVAEGSVFAAIDGRVVTAALLILFVARPVCAGLSLVGHRCPWREKMAIAFFGIRGLGSFYYLAYAMGAAEFGQAGYLWMTVCLVVILSIVMHGVLVTPVMRRLDDVRQPGDQ